MGALLSSYVTDLVSRRPSNVTIEVPVYPSVDVAVHYPVLRSALDNLVKNAFEAMPDGGRLSIGLDLESGPRVTVRDSGHGMSQEQQQALREGVEIDSAKRHGSGLGLAAVASAARHLRAQLDIDSRPGQTSISLLLPRS
jgi:signal transduction histidine kinase